MQRLSFAIIGGGPAAFYLSKCLAKLPEQPAIHIFEKEYCPFGLIRYGVAPDHISIKKAETTLSSISSYPYFQYYGNQAVDGTVLSELRQQYSGVIYAVGAQQNNQPKWFSKWHQDHPDNSKHILNARDVVYWYNNHPTYETYSLDLHAKRNVVVIGNGNVAVDIARVLLKHTNELENTQISSNALDSLRRSDVVNVTLIGRRGFTHSAFSLKEIRELSTAKIRIYCLEEELMGSMNESSYIECTSISNNLGAVVRMNKRKIDFLKEKCTVIKRAELEQVMKTDEKKVILRYLLEPVEIEHGKTVKMVVNTLSGEPFKQVAMETEHHESINFDLLINSTGFKVKSIVPQELDEKHNRIANSNGCVLQSFSSDKLNIGQYAVGWCKSGPRGVIDETLLSCEQTFNNIRIHINNKLLPTKTLPNFATSSNINFQRYLELKELELSRGDKQKFVKKKMSHAEVKQFFA